MKLSQDIVKFFSKQHYVIVSTINAEGRIHCSAKGLVSIDESGKIILADLYLNKTYRNLKDNNNVSITFVDEAKFKGYTLQGKADIILKEKVSEEILTRWEEAIVSRISKRVVQSVQTGSKTSHHHEAHLPVHLKYIIEIQIDETVNLAPPSHFKEEDGIRG